MSIRYQKRVNLGKGAGINLSKSGASYSQRTKWGSIGSRGFSIRTGIPGLSLRQNWGKGGGAGLAVMLAIGAFVISWLILYNAVRFIVHLISLIIIKIRNHGEKDSTRKTA
ncbi:DUF4236 domain-containing protein [Fulvivirga sp.]|uniref:DUF4236 domain-containing protein n=1 Tax=Fulvivirga sp. TaxID=1931237 RepID=UPI0032EC2DCA